MALPSFSSVFAFVPRPPGPRADPSLAAYRWGKPTVGEWVFSAGGSLWAPISLYLHGTLGQVADALAESGWSERDALASWVPLPGSAAYGAAFERSLLGQWPPPLPARYAPRGRALTAPEPATPPELLYQGEPPVLVYEKESDLLGHRRSLRLYDTGQEDAGGAEVWAVCAGRDRGLAFSARRPGRYLTPTIDKDADRERDALLADLASAGALKRSRALLVTWQDMGPEHPRSRDGEVYDLVLR